MEQPKILVAIRKRPLSKKEGSCAYVSRFIRRVNIRKSYLLRKNLSCYEYWETRSFGLIIKFLGLGLGNNFYF